MGPGDVGHGLDLGHFQYPQIGLPPLKPIKGIVVGAKVLGPLALPAKRVVKHPAKSDPVDASGMDAEPQDAARELIHDDQDPVSPQRGRFASEQIYTPETVLQVTEESQPRRTAGVRRGWVMRGEDAPNDVFIDADAERPSNLLSDSRSAPKGIA